MTRAPRTIWIITVTALPGFDEIRALRWALKTMLRRYGLRCVDIAREPHP